MAALGNEDGNGMTSFVLSASCQQAQRERGIVSGSSYDDCPHFRDEEKESQKGDVTPPRPHSRGREAEWGLGPASMEEDRGPARQVQVLGRDKGLQAGVH